MEEMKEYDEKEVSSAWEMEEVARIVSEEWREWKDRVARLFMFKFKQSSLQYTQLVSNNGDLIQKDARASGEREL